MEISIAGPLGQRRSLGPAAAAAGSVGPAGTERFRATDAVPGPRGGTTGRAWDVMMKGFGWDLSGFT